MSGRTARLTITVDAIIAGVANELKWEHSPHFCFLMASSDRSQHESEQAARATRQGTPEGPVSYRGAPGPVGVRRNQATPLLPRRAAR